MSKRTKGITPLPIPVPWVYVLVYLIGVGIQFLFPVNVNSERVRLLFLVLGIVLLIGGLALAGQGLLIFHNAHTTTTPGLVTSKLVTWGPYRFSRNPMYLGLFIAYIGETGILIDAWSLVLLLLVFAYVNWIIIPVEESQLHETFGEAYKQYCAKVRRWL